MANSVDPDEMAHDESTLFAQVLVFVCRAERVKSLGKINT